MGTLPFCLFPLPLQKMKGKRKICRKFNAFIQYAAAKTKYRGQGWRYLVHLGEYPWPWQYTPDLPMHPPEALKELGLKTRGIVKAGTLYKVNLRLFQDNKVKRLDLEVLNNELSWG